MLRQWAFALTVTGAPRDEVEYVLQHAHDLSDSEQNQLGIVNVRMTFLLDRDHNYDALEMLEEHIEKLEHKTYGFFERPERLGIAYPTFLGCLAYSAVIHAHEKNKRSTGKIQELIDKCCLVEQSRGQKAKLIWTPRSRSAILKAGREIHGLKEFVYERDVPQIPDDIVSDVREAAKMIVRK